MVAAYDDEGNIVEEKNVLVKDEYGKESTVSVGGVKTFATKEDAEAWAKMMQDAAVKAGESVFESGLKIIVSSGIGETDVESYGAAAEAANQNAVIETEFAEIVSDRVTDIEADDMMEDVSKTTVEGINQFVGTVKAAETLLTDDMADTNAEVEQIYANALASYEQVQLYTAGVIAKAMED
jgi:hypothetical protein